MRMVRKGEWLPLVVALALPQLAGFAGTLFTTPAIDGWYATLVRPDLAPPNWVFGPVWTTLFVLMGVALFLVWRSGRRQARVRQAQLVFYFQLALNTLWSALFFGLQSPLLGLWGIAALWLAIALTIKLFYPISRTAALLLLPYLAWVSFATYLTYLFWVLN